MSSKPLKIVRLIEPDLCLDCRFSAVAEVEGEFGAMQRIIRCRRLDCDNWDTSQVEMASGVDVDF